MVGEREWGGGVVQGLGWLDCEGRKNRGLPWKQQSRLQPSGDGRIHAGWLTGIHARRTAAHMPFWLL
jgi:hypothetical protein